MGMTITGALFLREAKMAGMDFEKTVTIGRQNLQISIIDLVHLFESMGERLSLAEAQAMLAESSGFSESFLKRLGATDVQSVDASEYEQATIIHDMNSPIPDSLHESFSAVIDGGTLEHVFNFPVAIANCMKMVRLNGHFVGVTPANNLTGHGFYQFSPELMYRIFSAENGFEVRHIILCEEITPLTWYEVTDPKEARSRVRLCNFRETYMYILAQRTKIVPIFARPPQQSDYVVEWDKAGPVEAPSLQPEAPPSRMGRFIPAPIRDMLRPLYRAVKEAPILLPGKRFPQKHYSKLPETQSRPFTLGR